MCFSPEMSFGSAAVLLPTGVYCCVTAARRCPRMWPAAVVPCIFAVQQAAEGLVWVGLQSADDLLTRSAARVYLFFALAFWPIWFSVAATVIERPGRKRWLLAAWTTLSTGWFWLGYLPVAAAPDGVAAHVCQHSVRYAATATDGSWFAPEGRWLVRGLYVLTVAVPLAVTSARRAVLLPAG